MKKTIDWGLSVALTALLVISPAAAADEKIDWGLLADFCRSEVREANRDPLNRNGVFVGKGGVRVVVPLMEADKERMRAFLKANIKRPTPESKRVKAWKSGQSEWIRNIRKIDRMEKRSNGDWNKGAPFAGGRASGNPKG